MKWSKLAGPFVLPPAEYRKAGTTPRSHPDPAKPPVKHDLDEMAEHELTIVLSLNNFVEQRVERSSLDYPVESEPGHDGRSRPFREGVENRWQNHGTCLSERTDPVRPNRLSAKAVMSIKSACSHG